MRLRVGSLSLRPAALPFGNSRPLIAQTPLPRATEAYGQFLGRDLNPQDNQLLLRTDVVTYVALSSNSPSFLSPALCLTWLRPDGAQSRSPKVRSLPCRVARSER